MLAVFEKRHILRLVDSKKYTEFTVYLFLDNELCDWDANRCFGLFFFERNGEHAVF